MTIILHGAPRTKKNSGVITTRGGRPRILPSPQFREWNRVVQPQLQLARIQSPGLPFRVPVNVKALFFRERDIGDANGFYQALADALEEGGIVENDRLIVQWDGSRLLKDATNPRIILTLEPIGGAAA